LIQNSSSVKIYSFPPIADNKATILILGTMPGKDSLKHNQYYAHPQNAFWKIMFTIFNTPISTDYTIKQALLLDNRIALWDVLKTCERDSSLDADIIKEEANDLKQFLQNHPQIKLVVFNGKAAMNFYKKHIKETSVLKITMPSTSPAHAISFDKKINKWSVLREHSNS
jgi:hypoxanthine-DNA glycosylase